MSRDGQPLGKLPSVKGVKPIVPRQHLGSLASVKVSHWKIAVGQGVSVPSPDIFDGRGELCFFFAFLR